MSTENQQIDESPQKDIPEQNPNNQNPPEEEHPEQPQKKEYIPDTIDHLKNMIQPLNDNISDINLVLEKGDIVPNEKENEEEKINTKEVVNKVITKTTITTTTTTKIIKDGKETSTTETTIKEKKESKEGGNEINIINKLDNIDNKEEKEENKIEEKNDDENKNINITKEQNELSKIDMASNITFGAPENLNYNSTLNASNVTFGVNNSNINLNQNNINNNSNISDSDNKSSEAGNNVIAEQKSENENEKDLNENQEKIKFGIVDNTQEKNDKGEIESSPNQAQELPKLDENQVKFGVNENKVNEEQVEKDKDDKNKMEVEPGEINEEINSNDKKEEKDKTENKKEEKSEPILNKPLFDKENSKNNQGESIIFEQKLFEKDESKENKIEENKININPIFNNSEQTKETFLKNNPSIIPSSNEAQTANTNNENQNSEIPSAVFDNQSNSNIYKTLNEMVTEGDVYNADSAKKTQTNPINVFNALNPDISNENSNLNNNQMLSLNKGVNPFKPNEPQNFINSNIVNNNNIDSNDNMETNESSFNPMIKINMTNNDKNISSPFASYAVDDNSKAFFLNNNKANEISVNPILTGDNKNPFFTKTENKEENTDGDIKSGLFPGLDQTKDNQSSNQNVNLEKKVKSNPVFPGGNIKNEEKNKKTNFFVDEDKNKNNTVEKGNIIFSNILKKEKTKKKNAFCF